MSAFLASQQTYDYIASGLSDVAFRQNSDHHYTVHRFLGIDKDATDDTLEHNITSAVCKLYDLNRLALVTRYGNEWDRDDSFSPTITRAATINLAQFIKCIGCVLYQCAEYLTHETDTFKQWHDLEYQLAYSYLERSHAKRRTVPMMVWVKPSVKEAYQHIATTEGISLSQVGATALEESLARRLHIQHAGILQPIIERAIAKQMRAYSSRIAMLLVRSMFASEQTRALTTNILGR